MVALGFPCLTIRVIVLRIWGIFVAAPDLGFRAFLSKGTRFLSFFDPTF